MQRLRRLLQHLTLTRAESTALLVIGSLYLLGFTWKYVQQNAIPFDAAVYAELDSLIASGSLVPNDTLPKRAKESTSDLSAEDSAATGTDGRLDVNRATLTQLIVLPGIGPALAARIVDYRETVGPFSREDDLVRVKGIGPAKLERIRPLIVVK